MSSLIEFVANLEEGKHDTDPTPAPVVFVGTDHVVAFVDDMNRRATVSLKLHPSAQWRALVYADTEGQGPASTPMAQREFVRYVSIQLAGSFDRDAEWWTAVRNVKFSTTDEFAGEVSQGRETRRASIDAEATGSFKFPDTVELNVRPFGVPDLSATETVECKLDIDTQNRTFALIPLPQAMDDARAAALDLVFQSVRAAVKCPVYMGTTHGTTGGDQ